MFGFFSEFFLHFRKLVVTSLKKALALKTNGRITIILELEADRLGIRIRQILKTTLLFSGWILELLVTLLAVKQTHPVAGSAFKVSDSILRVTNTLNRLISFDYSRQFFVDFHRHTSFESSKMKKDG